MHISERVVGDVTILEVAGSLVADEEGPSLKDKVRSLIQGGCKRVLIDLGNVQYMDSSGLGDLVRVFATTKNAGGVLKLMRVTRRLSDLLTITKLVTVFDSYDSETEALASFAPQ